MAQARLTASAQALRIAVISAGVAAIPAMPIRFSQPLTFFVIVRALAISPKPSGPSSRGVSRT